MYIFDSNRFLLKVHMCGPGGGPGGGNGGADGTGDGGGGDGGPGGGGPGGPSGGNVGPGAPGGGGGATGRGDQGQQGAVGAPGTVSGPGGVDGMGPSPGGSGGMEGVDADINAAAQAALAADVGNLSVAAQQSLAQQAAVNSAISEANQETTNLAKAVSLLGKLAQFAATMMLGETVTGIVTGFLTSLGMNSDSVAAAIDGVLSGNGADVASSIGVGDFDGGPTGGGPGDDYSTTGNGDSSDGGGTGDTTGGTVASNDPLSYDFWNSFVDDWIGTNGKSAKQMYGEDDAFKKSKVEPAIGQYQSVLADLANQANTGTGNYKPITFGMGDFRSSFVPRSGLRVAEDLKNYGKENLTSELALTDVMQPNKGNLDYMDVLKGLAKWQFEQNQSRDLAEKGFNVQQNIGTFQPDDKGTWLDAIKDIVQIGDTAGDAWNKIFGNG